MTRYLKETNTGLVGLVLFALAALAQCSYKAPEHCPADACGGSGSRPVTIGGTLVVACH